MRARRVKFEVDIKTSNVIWTICMLLFRPLPYRANDKYIMLKDNFVASQKSTETPIE